jgi:Mg2+/Co2+ transporter CorB
MSLSLILLILAVIVLVFGSAFFSSSETALTAASDARMHALAKRGNKNASAVEALRRHKERLISSLLIGNNMVNVVATSLATSAAITLFNENGVLISSVTMTILLVVFAEVMPKTYAFKDPNRFSLSIARPVQWIVLLLTPLTIALDAFIRLVIPAQQVNQSDRQEELRGMIALHGSLSSDAGRSEEAVMLTSILDLGKMAVAEIMTHRASVAMVSADIDSEIAFHQILASPYTRLPVYAGKSDNIIGVLHVKALLRAIGRNPENAKMISIGGVATEPYFVPETTMLIDQLQAFRDRREHFAIVVDEYGDFRGIVTLEDILEEIVGAIDDEHDIQLDGITQQDDGSWIVDGHISIRDLNRELNWELPDDGATTIAGMILHETQTIPELGQEFRFHQTRLRILRRKRNKLERIRIWHDINRAEA